MREERGIDPIRQDEIDRHLAAAGFAVDDRLRWMLELALYPAYRDVYAAAEAQLRGAATPGRWRLAVRPRLHRHRSPFRSLAFIRRRSVPHQRWRTTGCIAPRPRQRSGSSPRRPDCCSIARAASVRRTASANGLCARSAGLPCCRRSRCRPARRCGVLPRRTSSSSTNGSISSPSTMAAVASATRSCSP